MAVSLMVSRNLSAVLLGVLAAVIYRKVMKK